jgi:hypothetical protein
MVVLFGKSVSPLLLTLQLYTVVMLFSDYVTLLDSDLPAPRPDSAPPRAPGEKGGATREEEVKPTPVLASAEHDAHHET